MDVGVDVTKLPREVLGLILGYFQSNEESLFVSLVCKNWSTMIKRSPIPINKVVGYYASLDSLTALILIRKIINNDEAFFCRAFFRKSSSRIVDWSLAEIQHLPTQVHESATLGAAQGGHLEFLKALHNINLLQYQFGKSTLEVRENDFTEIKWAREHNVKWDGSLCAYAAMGGHLDIIQWARTIGCQWDRWTCVSAAAKNYVHIIEFATSNGCDCDADILPSAALYGSLDVLEWAKYTRYWRDEQDEELCYYAAYGGHLEVLKWLKAYNCRWDQRSITNAAKQGHLEVVQWLRANGCQWGGNTLVDTILMDKYEVAKWLLENGCPWPEKKKTRGRPPKNSETTPFNMVHSLKMLRLIKDYNGPWNSELQKRLESLEQ